MKRASGIYATLGNTTYFIPDPLPPRNPHFKMTKSVTSLHEAALKSLKKLNAISAKLPDMQRFVRGYVMKEALLSSEIEGIHTTLLDVFTQSIEPNPKKISKNARLVLNYTDALMATVTLLQEKDLPISTRVLLHAHDVLMGSESQANPGKFRRQAVRVGSLVPPPADKIPSLMHDLEEYINAHDAIPPLIQAGLVHVQFETIHPFLDGNGRVGRLLIVLMLLDKKLLSLPILYPSLYFKSNRFAYYHWLDSVRTQGNFEGWITFYLKAIKAASNDACKRIEKIEKLIKKLKNNKTLRAALNKLNSNLTPDDVINQFIAHPVLSIDILAKGLERAPEIATEIITSCEKLKILTKNPGNGKKLWQFKFYVDIINQ